MRATSRSKAVLIEQDKRCGRYCIPTEFFVLEQQKVIGNIFFGDSEVDDSTANSFEQQ